MNARKPLLALLTAVIIVSGLGMLTAMTLCWIMPSGWEFRAGTELGRKICYVVMMAGSAVWAFSEYKPRKRAKTEEGGRTSTSATYARRWG